MSGRPAAKRRIEGPLKAFVDAGGVPGLVVGAFTPQGTFYFAYGTDPGMPGRKLDERTPYHVASISKLFTAVALAGMVREGKVALDDSPDRFLPADVQMPSRGGKVITLRHLATHTSGLPTGERGDPDRSKATDQGWPWFYGRIPQIQLVSDPGAKVLYSNIGMALLGHCLELASGTPYTGLVAARILAPLGMNATAVPVPAGSESPVFHSDVGIFAPAGGFHSDAEDLVRFAKAALGVDSGAVPTALSAAFDLTFIRQDGLGDSKLPLHLGWWEDDRGRLSHSGLQHAFVGIDRAHGVAAVILCTGQTDLIGALGGAVLSALAGEPARFPKPRRIVKMPAESLRRFEGDYRAADGKGVIGVKADAERNCLLLSFDGKGASVMWPESDLVFFCKEWKCDLVFPAGAGAPATVHVVMSDWQGDYAR